MMAVVAILLMLALVSVIRILKHRPSDLLPPPVPDPRSSIELNRRILDASDV